MSQLVIVCGRRSGTSIMYRSLLESGFTGSRNVEGGSLCQHPTEDRIFAQINIDMILKRKVSLGIIRRFEQYLENENIEILKHPHLVYVLPVWKAQSEIFRKAKYLWMRRNTLDAAKSLIRQRYQVPPRLRQKVRTVPVARKVLEHSHSLWAKELESLQTLSIWLEDLKGDTPRAMECVSRFVGRKVTGDLIETLA